MWMLISYFADLMTYGLQATDYHILVEYFNIKNNVKI
jgi:hypothetical protein